jgi:hypothetical protein
MAMFMKYSGYSGRLGLAAIGLILGIEAHALYSALARPSRDNLAAKLKQPGDGAPLDECNVPS